MLQEEKKGKMGKVSLVCQDYQEWKSTHPYPWVKKKKWWGRGELAFYTCKIRLALGNQSLHLSDLYSLMGFNFMWITSTTLILLWRERRQVAGSNNIKQYKPALDYWHSRKLPNFDISNNFFFFLNLRSWQHYYMRKIGVFSTSGHSVELWYSQDICR